MNRPRRVAVLTSGRQDWDILRSTAIALRDAPDFELQLIVAGMHCDARFGQTERLISAEGFTAAARLPWLVAQGEGAAAVLNETAAALTLTGAALAELRADALLIVGDRYETTAAALAATLAQIPIIHLHGGEETEGAMDNALRHAITKLSQLHLVAHEVYASRVRAMGEAEVYVVGAPGLDNLRRSDLAAREELEDFLKLPLRAPLVVVTLQPTTLGDPAEEARELAAACDLVAATYVITLPNADPGAEVVRAAMIAAGQRPGRVAVAALGARRYWGLMHLADAMLGNSSSGVIEAPALGLPTVNVGDRQKGRLRGPGVIDVAPQRQAIARALTQALSPEWRTHTRAAPPPLGAGDGAERILTILRASFPTSTRKSWSA